MKFQDLEAQDTREYWANEAHDFTPWIASRIGSEDASQLEDTLGLDLDMVDTEKDIGRYRVDVLAETVDDGRTVVIENQLERSDHDHLGKAIAYAAGVDADIIAWLAPKFNDEHRDAMEWLNENSREGVDFFALRIEVWKIGDSEPAVRLNPVEKPSEWREGEAVERRTDRNTTVSRAVLDGISGQNRRQGYATERTEAIPTKLV